MYEEALLTQAGRRKNENIVTGKVASNNYIERIEHGKRLGV